LFEFLEPTEPRLPRRWKAIVNDGMPMSRRAEGSMAK
jgi:hypothetical protein